MFWGNLPTEVRLAVLECLVGGRMAKYASVCSEWQKFFEPVTMRSLNIKDTDKKEFRKVFDVTDRRRYLRQLTLVMQFKSTYPRQNSQKPSREWTAEKLYQFARYSTRVITGGRYFVPDLERIRMNSRFSNFLFFMFIVLSRWKQQEIWPRGIHLAIVDNSRSSWQALAEEFEPGETVIGDGTTISTEAQEWSKRVVLANHDWMLVLYKSTFRGMRNDPVPAITRLSAIARYQNFYPGSLGRIMSLLPSLWKFDWSMRVAEFPRNQVRFSQWMLDLMDSWSPQLKEIKVLRAPQARGSPTLSAQSFSFPGPFSLGLARIAQNLTRLSFQQPIDAFEFFQCQRYEYEYRNLQSLSVCSTHRILDEFPGSTDRPVLALCADMIPKIPNLQTFSLFSITEGASAVACFNPKNGGPLILVWDWPFLPDKATFGCILKIRNAFWAYPKLRGLVYPASTERIWHQIAFMNSISDE
ncbi:uncharacterized protein FTOL_02938 [Fusarium torulosum]|uniref:DUF6546 domain-containing protein n=1 Tax=Fusarium torulosum TaxID=33205 RepID=A0AAE8M3Q5_9HYPO|nr:uncharacterized protein FTOL_02938 [Fusarium torulosum]